MGASGVWIILVAVLTGILSGMGAGGGSVLVPALVFLFGVEQHAAQGATLLAFVPTAAVAAYAHWRNRLIRFDYVGRLAVGSVVGALAGAGLAAVTSTTVLRKVFGAYLAIIAIYAFFCKDHLRD